MNPQPAGIDIQVVHAPVHQRRLGSEVMLAAGDDDPVILGGLAADLWRVTEEPISIRQAALLLAARHQDRSPAFEQAVSEAVALVRPWLKPARRSSEPGSTAQRTNPAAEFAFGDEARELGETFGMDPSEAEYMLASAQISVGRSLESLGKPIRPPLGPRPAFRQRLIPGLSEVLSRLTEEEASDVAQQNLNVQRHAILCEQTLVSTARLLDEMGVGYLALKGTITAHLDYGRPDLRQVGDVDVLIRPEDHSAVVANLKTSGFRHIVGGDPGPFGLYKSSYLIAPNGVELDLHHRLFRHGLDHSAIWLAQEEAVIAGKTISAPSRPWRLLHACAHAILSRDRSRRVSGFLDPVRISHVEPDSVGSMIDLAGDIQLARLTASSLEFAHRLLDVQYSLDLPHSSGIRDTVAVWAFNQRERHVLREQVSILLGLSPSDAGRWLLAWVAPSPTYTGPNLAARARSTSCTRPRRW